MHHFMRLVALELGGEPLNQTEILNILRSFNFWEKDDIASRGILRTEYLSSLRSFTKTESMIIVSGQRRSGKSYLLRQYIDELVGMGIARNDILYLNLFLDTLKPLRDKNEFSTALDFFEKTIATKNAARIYLIIDEIVEMKEWQSLVATLLEHPKKNYKVIVSGSNTRLLIADLSKELRGRYYDLPILPLGFREFCMVKDLDQNDLTSFYKYMDIGGMPEVVLAPDIHSRANLLANIRHSTVKKDIIDRYRADPDIIERLIEYTRSIYGSLLSNKRMTEQIKKSGVKIAEATIAQYMTWLQDVFWIKKAEIYSARTSDILKRSEHKYYLGDHGFAYNSSQNQGRLLENIIFNELRRSLFETATFQGYHYGQIFEIDFLATKGQRTLFVQVALTVGDPFSDRELHAREFGNFAKLGRRSGEKIVVSLDLKRYEAPGVLHLNPVEFIRHLNH